MVRSDKRSYILYSTLTGTVDKIISVSRAGSDLCRSVDKIQSTVSKVKVSMERTCSPQYRAQEAITEVTTTVQESSNT